MELQRRSQLRHHRMESSQLHLMSRRVPCQCPIRTRTAPLRFRLQTTRMAQVCPTQRFSCRILLFTHRLLSRMESLWRTQMYVSSYFKSFGIFLTLFYFSSYPRCLLSTMKLQRIQKARSSLVVKL